MADQIVTMQRYEIKYVLTADKVDEFKKRISKYMQLDKYGLTSIASLYYDTPDYKLIRTSIEKPLFKEKIRLRSYGPATKDSTLFLELKRKAFGIVYKRRVPTNQQSVNDFFDFNGEIAKDGQISREIKYFRDFYKNLRPSCVIVYDREAYFQPNGDLRLTLDFNPRFRLDNLTLGTDMSGNALLPKGSCILEIKVQEAMPLWLTEILSDLKIYKTSFSKYGEAFKTLFTNTKKAKIC